VRLEAQAKAFGRLLEKEFEIIGLKTGMKVLDAGCGTGAVARKMAAKVSPGEVYGIDIDSLFISEAKKLATNEGMKNYEPKQCSNCVLIDVYRGYVQKDASSLKICIRLRALALRDGRLFLCKSFNYGFGVMPQKPQPEPEPKTEEQAPLLMFTERHHTGDSWKVGDRLYSPEQKAKQPTLFMRIEEYGNSCNGVCSILRQRNL